MTLHNGNVNGVYPHMTREQITACGEFTAAFGQLNLPGNGGESTIKAAIDAAYNELTVDQQAAIDAVAETVMTNLRDRGGEKPKPFGRKSALMLLTAIWAFFDMRGMDIGEYVQDALE